MASAQPAHPFLHHVNYALNDTEHNAVLQEKQQLHETISSLEEDLCDHRAAIQSHRQKIEQSYAKIEKHREEIENQTERLQATQRRLERARARLMCDERLLFPSSFRSIPDEVLSIIFVNFTDMMHTNASDEYEQAQHGIRGLRMSGADIYEPHNILRSVCRRWDSIVLAEPRIWQTVWFCMPPSAFVPSRPLRYRQQDEEHWGHIALNVGRARTLPLDLQVKIDRDSLPLEPAACDFLHRLMALLPRTKYLDIELMSYGIFGYIPDTFTSNLPMPSRSATFTVEHFALYHGFFTLAPQLAYWMEHIMASMPMLKDAHLPHLAFFDQVPNLFSSTSQSALFTDVFLEDVNMNTVADLLKSAPSLASLKTKKLREPWIPLPSEPVRSTSLVELSLEPGFEDFLRYLTLPALKTLEIGLSNYSSSMRRTQWPYHKNIDSAFFERSGCSLDSLAVRCAPPMDVNDITPIVISQPSLSTLVLQHCPFRLFSLLCSSSLSTLSDMCVSVVMERGREEEDILDALKLLGERHTSIQDGSLRGFSSWEIVFNWYYFVEPVVKELEADMREMERRYKVIGSVLMLSVVE